MHDEELSGPERSAFEAWQPEPAPGFADRVMAAHEVRQAARRRARSRLLAAVAVVLLVAGGLVFALGRSGEAASGRLAAARERTTVRLGQRGLAVAEAGTALSWRVGADGQARVRQSSGNAFYRVEPGGPFEVLTPAGRVTVRGTCFRVEVTPMRPSRSHVLSGAAGAAVTALVMVTVYEGRVLFANEHGRQSLAAGESASAGDGTAPSRDEAAAGGGVAVAFPEPPPDAPRELLLSRDAAQRAELSRLRRRLAELEDEQGGDDRAAPGPGNHEPGDRFFAPTAEDLQEMATRCELHWDSPPLGPEPDTIGDERAERLGLTAEERTAVDRVNRSFHARVLADLRALYVEATGDTGGVRSLSPEALGSEIVDKSTNDEVAELRRRLSAERAGMVAPPPAEASLSPAERYFRLMGGLGDAYERELGQAIGADRARDLRTEHGGWGSKTRHAGCPGE